MLVVILVMLMVILVMLMMLVVIERRHCGRRYEMLGPWVIHWDRC